MLIWLRRLAYVAFTAILGVAYKLAENAALGWGDNVIGDWLGLSSPTVPQIVKFAWLWVLPFGLAALTLYGYHKFHRWYETRHPAATARSPRVVPKNEIATSDDRGLLDYRADVIAGFETISQIFVEWTVRMNTISRETNPAAKKLQSQSLDKQLTTMRSLAKSLKAHAVWLHDGNARYRLALANISEGLNAILSGEFKVEPEAHGSLRVLLNVLDEVNEATEVGRRSSLQLVTTMDDLPRIEKEFNVAKRDLSEELKLLIENVNQTSSVLVNARKAGNQLLQAASIKDSSGADFNISDWLNHETYFVWVAACLWIDIKPVPKIDQDHPAYPMLQRIKGALDTGQIESLSGAANINARVRREELVKLASIHGEKPRFLYPSEAQNNFEEEFAAAFNRNVFKDKKGDRSAVLLRLTELRDDGVMLRNSPGFLATPADMDKWFTKVDDWANDVIDALKNLNMADSKWFTTLDTLPPARVAIPNTRTGERGRFELVFRMHDFRLVRLNDLLKKYGVGAGQS